MENKAEKDSQAVIDLNEEKDKKKRKKEDPNLSKLSTPMFDLTLSYYSLFSNFLFLFLFIYSIVIICKGQ
jgi:hypothetical protein